MNLKLLKFGQLFLLNTLLGFYDLENVNINLSNCISILHQSIHHPKYRYANSVIILSVLTLTVCPALRSGLSGSGT